jgi:hypothetical protein
LRLHRMIVRIPGTHRYKVTRAFLDYVRYNQSLQDRLCNVLWKPL